MARMSYLRFHHVFYILMALSGIVAFLVPSRVADRYQPRAELLFAPVARPVGAAARMMTRRSGTPTIAPNDTRKSGRKTRPFAGR
jgi:hypothetical protein